MGGDDLNGLGKLQKIANLHSAWPHEARNFTPWLAGAENLSQLAEAIGLGVDGLELERVEESVGDFFADIIARDTLGGEGGRVLIENQFGRTNHDHLGKLLTYASGVKDVKTIVWISEVFREEHRAALDWLNRHTETGIAFFGIEIELWKIGDSAPAPRFNVIARPNDWERTVGETGTAEQSETGQFYVRYWSAFAEFLRVRKGPLKPPKGSPQHWMSISIGRSHFGLAAIASTQKNFVRAEMNLTGPNSHRAFELLVQQRDKIEAEFGDKLVWDQKVGRNQVRISQTRENLAVRDEKDWGRQHLILAEMLEKLYRAFHVRVRELDFDRFGDDEFVEVKSNQSSSFEE